MHNILRRHCSVSWLECSILSNGVTFYPGIGADEEIEKLERLVGKITAYWAQVEDQLFSLFVAAVAGGPPMDHQLGPYRAVFFTFSSYEGKMRMVHNAMKARYAANEELMTEWGELRKRINGFAALRNEIAHLTPMAKGTQDPKATAVVRLVPPFWKGFPNPDFDKGGYSWAELTTALASFWSFDPSLNIWETSHQMLGYQLQQFIMKLMPPPLSAEAPPSIP